MGIYLVLGAVSVFYNICYLVHNAKKSNKYAAVGAGLAAAIIIAIEIWFYVSSV